MLSSEQGKSEEKMQAGKMIYIHVPYCMGKCIYCNFYSGGNPDWNAFAKAIVSELSERIHELTVDKTSNRVIDSLYIGGGTPSLIPAEVFKRMIDDVKRILHDNQFTNGNSFEFTIEVNPEDVSTDKIKAWKEAGVNRVSIGTQSLNDNELAIIKRRHNADKALDSINMLKRYFNNISVDIIYGLPGQTEETLRETLEKIISAGPQHISAYALTFEEGTPLEILRRQGKIRQPDEDEYRVLGDVLNSTLKNAGYERYEISNYSLPGFRSQHNSGYWSGKAYLGLGPSAASYDGQSIRRTNPSDLKKYLTHFGIENIKCASDTEKEASFHKPAYFYEEERLTAEEKREEKIFLTIRTAEGMALEEFQKEFGEEELKKMLGKAEKWIKGGELEIEEGRLKLTPKGIWISDIIAVEIS